MYQTVLHLQKKCAVGQKLGSYLRQELKSIKVGIVRAPIIIQLMTGGSWGAGLGQLLPGLLPAAPSWSRPWTMMIIIMMTIDY